jgi:hypothetical protein
MNTRAILGVALTGAVVLVSCTQDNTSAPSLVPTEATLAKANPNTCDFTVTRASAKEYFALLKDPVYAKIDAMQDAYKAGGAANTTTTGFAVLAQTAANVKDASKIKGTPDQGSTFVNDVFQCMTVAGYSPSSDFSAALGSTGLFDVVFANSSAPVVARYAVGNSPAFGAEPNGGTWPVSGPTLFYGSSVVVSTLSGETVQGVVADLKTLPVYESFASPFKAGACKVTDSFARALHQHGTDVTILAPVQMTFCNGDDDVLGSVSSPTSSFAYGLRRAANWLAPRPLFAATMPTSFGGGGAGLVDGLSEIGPVSFTSVVSFSNAPTNIALSAQPHSPPIAVIDTTSKGNPLAGVQITLAVIGNSGSFSYPVGSNIALTNDLGIATFPNFVIDKSGGYTITATSAVGGVAQATYQITGN